MIIERGAARHCNPGEWVQVGNMDAKRWVEEGAAVWAELPNTGEVGGGYSAGFLVLDPDHMEMVEHHAGLVSGARLSAEAFTGDWLPFERTIIWQTTVPLRAELVPAALKLLDRWQLAIPLYDYRELAQDVGDDNDRAETQDIVRDLRCLLYDTHLMFVRRSGDTRALFDAYDRERDGGDERLAFLRALYQTKPVICALPATWTKGRDYIDV
jgi:hypothetical protein